MTVQTIRRLNLLNQQFYSLVGEEFDRTRQQYWEGWDRLVPNFSQLAENKSELSVLDLACGNARFGRFLSDRLPKTKLNYLGIERESELLKLSDVALQKTALSYSLKNLDIIEALISENLFNTEQRFDLIMVFGMLHHVPSAKLRRRLIKELSKTLKNGGLLVVTSWQFAHQERFRNRFVNPKLLGIEPEELEENDYILDWRRAQTGYRYCHFCDLKEMHSLLTDRGMNDKEVNCLDKLEIIDSFSADGKTHDLNNYIVVRKIA